MMVKFGKDGKVDRSQWGDLPAYPRQLERFEALCDTIDECVAALRQATSEVTSPSLNLYLERVLCKIGLRCKVCGYDPCNQKDYP